jgi:hypothetical protein
MEIKLPSFEGFLSTDAERIAAQGNINESIKKVIGSANDLLVEFRKENFSTADFFDKQVCNLNSESDLFYFTQTLIDILPEIKTNNDYVLIAKLKNLVRHILHIARDTNDQNFKFSAIRLGELLKSNGVANA